MAHRDKYRETDSGRPSPRRVTSDELDAITSRAGRRTVEFRFERSGSRGKLVCVGAKFNPRED